MSKRLQEQVNLITDMLEKNSDSSVSGFLESMSPAEISRVMESLPLDLRRPFWEQVTLLKKGEVLLELQGILRRSLIKQTDEDELIACLSVMQMDEIADLDDDLPMSVVSAMVNTMDIQRRERYEKVKLYPDDVAGGLMDVDATAVRGDVSFSAVFRYLRRLRQREGSLPEHLDSLMVIDRHNRFMGTLPLSHLVSYDASTTVSDVMICNVVGITPLTSALEVTRIFEDQDLLSAPVIDDKGYLVGRITVDDVINVIRDQADREVLGRAGLDQHEDMFAPVINSSLRRAIWLGINLLTAFLAAWVIGLFEGSIEKMVALAVLMPVVASMGGVAGSQTLTLVTRGMALDQISRRNIWKLAAHELAIGGFNGVFWAGVVTMVAYYWFNDLKLGLVFGSAMLIVIFTGALVGTFIPLILKRIGVDPALAGGVVLTTATDAIGFFAFLGLATIMLF
ncbi:MAG: magnesium transporter [Shewanella psychromarinicola]|jgi:magnesium transporter|uniref:magnesium transporter n=1 Tax=Shewanella psychromarinicola TaxID=2487742 RepID=UPI003EE9C5E3